MVKQHHKILSLILCLILAVSALCVGTVGAFAASGDTVYVKVNNGWTNLHCYMWSGNGDPKNATWPGVEMTKVSDDVYSYTLDNDYEKIIFNNGNSGDGNQTTDRDYPGNGKIFDLSAGTWSDYSGAVTPSSSATTPSSSATTPTSSQSTTAATSSGDGITVYCKNEAGWSNLHCYMWNSEDDKNKTWPGEAMTEVGDGVWMYTSSKVYANCIFNAGQGGAQTDDLTAKDGYIFNNSKSSDDGWEVYDTSPLQIKSYTADPSTGVYVDTDVTLSANAVNKNGAAVSYKFSVTNSAGGTSVLSDYSSASSVMWTPTSAGTYTITFDFKDGEGNLNSRTLSLTVEDASLLVKPVIKSVVPANLNLIQTNKATTVTVKAGGGNTGTKLLFYKYIVTDPNGVKNIPYYTLNSTYSFTPTMTGKYTVNVYVQGSDNSTVSKTYTYTATTDDVTNPTSVTTPTTPTSTPTTPTSEPTAPSSESTAPSSSPAVLKGDVDGDGEITVKDATYIQCIVAEIGGYYASLEVGDVDGDGQINVKDATAIQWIVVRL